MSRELPSASSPTIIVNMPGHNLSRFFSWLGWAGFVICGLLLLSRVVAKQEYFDTTAGIQEKYHSGARLADAKIAIIDVSGVILDGDGYVKRQIDRIAEDESVKAVVVRVNSPGGTVTGSDYIYHHLVQLRERRQLPMVVSMGSIAASGGYYVAMAVGQQPDSIFAEPTTTTGSIGVIIPHYDFSGLLQEISVKDDSIASHPRKQLLSLTKPMSEEERQILQRYVNEAFNRFKTIVHQGRPKLASGDDHQLVHGPTGTDLATGEIFTANQALEYGLVDKIGFLEEATARAAELANLELSQVRVVQFERPPSLLDLVLVQQRSARGPLPLHTLDALIELSAPRAWFLASTLPLLVRSDVR